MHGHRAGCKSKFDTIKYSLGKNVNRSINLALRSGSVYENRVPRKKPFQTESSKFWGHVYPQKWRVQAPLPRVFRALMLIYKTERGINSVAHSQQIEINSSAAAFSLLGEGGRQCLWRSLSKNRGPDGWIPHFWRSVSKRTEKRERKY